MPSFAEQFRSEYVVGVRATGADDLAKLQLEAGRVEQQLRKLHDDFVSGVKDAEAYRQEFARLGGEFNFFAKAADQVVRAQEAIAAAARKQAEEVEAAAQREADAFAALAARHQAMLDGWAAASAAAAAKENAQLNALLEGHRRYVEARAEGDQMAARARAEASDRAAAKEQADLAALLEAHEQESRREAEAAELAAQREADAFAATAGRHEQMLARAEAAEDEKERRDAEDLAAAEARHKRFLEAWAADEERAKRQVLEETIKLAEREGAELSKRAAAEAAAVDREEADLARMLGAHAEMAARWEVDDARIAQADADMLADLATRHEATMARLEADASRKAVAMATTITDTARAMAGVPAMGAAMARELDRGAAGANHAAYAMLHLAHAVQDAQYGFGAVLNNIPLVVQAFGGGPGLAGTIMIAGVTLNVFAGQVRELGIAVGLLDDKTKIYTGTLAGMQEKLKALEGKAWKVDVDYQAIEAAKREVKELEERLKAVSEEADREKKGGQKPLADQAKHIVEGMGGPGALAQVILGRAREHGLTQFGAPADVSWEKTLREVLVPFAERQAREAANPVTRFAMEQHLQWRQSQLTEVQRRMQDAEKEFAFGPVGAFLQGDPAAIQRMKVLGAEGRLPAGAAQLVRRMPGTPAEAEERRQQGEIARAEGKEAREAAERDERLKEQLNRQGAAGGADPLRDREVGAAVSAFGSPEGFGGDVAGRVRAGIAAGRKAADVRQDLKGWVEERLRAGGVREQVADQVALEILNRVVDKVMSGLVGRGGDVAAAAGAEIAAERAKAAAKEAGKARAADARGRADAARALREGGQAWRQGQAEDLFQQFGGEGGYVQPQQAQAGAHHLESLMKGGTNPIEAMRRVQMQMAQFVQHNIAMQAQLTGMNDEMAQMLAAANQTVAGQGAMLGMGMGQLRRQRTMQPFGMPTIPVGGF